MSNNKLLVSLAILLLTTASAFASAQGMPWETPLETIKNSLTGPVAGVVSLLGVLGAGATLIFGHAEMNGFIKTVLFLVLVISLVIVGNVLIDMFSSTGALI